MMNKACLCLAVSVGLAAPCLADTEPNMVLNWNEIALQAIRVDRSAPPVASRALAMMHVAIYDAVNASDRAHQPFYVQVDPPGDVSREAAVASAAYRVLVHLYPDQIAYFDFSLYEALKYVPNAQSKTDGIALGQYVADQIIAWRDADGWDAHVDYIPGNAPGDWRPTPPGFAPALLPQWGAVEPWTMNSSSQFRAPAFPVLTSPEYAAAVNEVKDLGRVDSQSRTSEQTEVARFWADADGTCTIVGHWNAIAEHCSEALGYGVGKNALLFAKLNVAMADAAIATWETKYHYNLWRPFHAITLADQDGNEQTIVDPTWTSLIDAPAFPEYVSGHSAFGAAAARILTYEFGTDHMNFTDVSDGLPGVYRTFTSFSQAAEENGRSRIYGGVHFEFSNQAGQQLGRSLADYVQSNFFQPVASDRPIMCLPTYYHAGYINVFEAFNCTPGQLVYFLWDSAQGSRSVRPCPGVTIDLARPRRFGRDIADANGYVVMERVVPVAFRGQTRYGQTFQPGSCGVSNLVQGWFPLR